MAGAGMMKHTVSALVACTGTRAHRHCLCLDGHDGMDAVGGDGCLCGSGRGGSLCALSAGRGALGCGGHAGVQRGEFVHHAVVLVLLVCVDSLRVLTEVVETRELLAAVARERPLASMFPAQRGTCVSNRLER